MGGNGAFVCGEITTVYEDGEDSMFDVECSMLDVGCSKKSDKEQALKSADYSAVFSAIQPPIWWVKFLEIQCGNFC